MSTAQGRESRSLERADASRSAGPPANSPLYDRLTREGWQAPGSGQRSNVTAEAAASILRSEIQDQARQAARGWSEEQHAAYRAEAEARGDGGRHDADPLPHKVPGCKHRYSILRTMRLAAEARALNGLEGEVHAELSRRTGRTARGVWVPTDVEFRALTSATGAGAIPTVFPLGSYVDVLRARSVLTALGATVGDFSPDLGGAVQMPRKSAASSPGWVDESGDATDTNLVADQWVKFYPHSVSAQTKLTRQFWRAATPDLDAWVWNDLATSIAIEIEKKCFQGQGTAPPSVPLGLLANGSVSSVVTGTNGAAPTWANLCEMERVVGAANGDAAVGARLGWLTSPNGRSVLRRTDKGGATATGRFAWTDKQTILGWPAFATTNYPSNLTQGSGTNLSPLTFGNWADLLVNLFGAVDMLFDPFRQSTSGVYVFRAIQDVDVQVRHWQSFCHLLAMVTT